GVRDREHLRPLRQPGQSLAHGVGDRAADARVDFIEDECRGGAALGKADFDGEKKTRQFAAGGHSHQRSCPRTGTGADEKLRAIVTACRCERPVAAQVDAELRSLELERRQFGHDRLFERPGAAFALGAQRAGGLMVGRARAADCCFEPSDLLAAGVESVETVGVFLRERRQVFDRGAVLAPHSPEREQALLAALQLTRIERAGLERLLDCAPSAFDRLDCLVQRFHARLNESRRLRHAMMQGEKVAADIREARDHLTGEAALLPALLSVSRRLQRRMPQAPALIEPSVKALDEAIEAVEGAWRAVEQALEACAFDPRELERCEERLFALRAMGRKYGAAIENLPALAQKYADGLDALDAGREEIARLEAAVGSARAAYHEAAGALSAERERSARALEQAVMAELAPLKLERAEFSVDLRSDRTLASTSGYDRAEFLVRTNPGSRAGALMRVASGGELSRFLLAIKVCLAERGTAPTLVFDEIDAGVGGAVADAMGQRLARLSQRAQVLAVTHAPQVAARAQSHYRIAKSDVGKGDRVVTSVSRLGAGERREEIARMLAGAEITREARAAAVSLIERAG